MKWFNRICRNTGLMIHHITKPVKPQSHKQSHKTVEEKQVSPDLTLRRTTIEEIEIRKPQDKNADDK
ncbi:hypothetical protein KS4_24240 [Poriferisphaera corsica]|uniref:Uncharacterized protein n=1 Tax=Poriferisphaera corsica TaxID=2528020 RepID=A0A517YVV1_9BACT|nr:hypothetical protein [Poriferisphaera corsica]QDU34356.1 hypothetical protein KS4_24240 [Poriferisphaera corsica]